LQGRLPLVVTVLLVGGGSAAADPASVVPRGAIACAEAVIRSSCGQRDKIEDFLEAGIRWAASRTCSTGHGRVRAARVADLDALNLIADRARSGRPCGRGRRVG
jgi:hypothetical protein